uniref:Odorant receptor n=1 Tax=Lutzomyia longipalpis TaxID=7200 RepID=A0A3F2ZD98_LUTLO
MSPQMEEFVKAKPRIDFLITHLTLDVISGSWKSCFCKLLCVSFNILYFFLVFLHLKNIKTFELSFNTLITLLTTFVISGYGIRIFVGFFKREKFESLIENIKKLYKEQEEDEELERILRKHLTDSLRIFQLCYRWGIYIYFVAGFLCSSYFRLNEDYGLMYELPFIASDNFKDDILWKEFPYIVQNIFYMNLTTSTILLDIGILFLSLQVIAEINILSDYIKLLNEKIKTDPKILRKIIERHCSIIENLNLLSEITFESSILQLILTCVALLFGMTFLITYAKGLGNYAIIICGGGLGLPLCILGQFIQVKADILSETLYQTNWHELRLKDQKMFLIILGMAQREYGLKAAGVYDINLYTFVQIFKIAFSYCAVLYSLSQ